MKELQYTIRDPMGLHARTAAALVKAACRFQCAVTLGTPQKMVNAKAILGVMTLALKQGQVMAMAFDGPDEATAAAYFTAFLQDNL